MSGPFIGRDVVRRVLITGGGGSVGSELARQVSGCQPAQLTLVDASLLAQVDLREGGAEPAASRSEAGAGDVSPTRPAWPPPPSPPPAPRRLPSSALPPSTASSTTRRVSVGNGTSAVTIDAAGYRYENMNAGSVEVEVTFDRFVDLMAPYFDNRGHMIDQAWQQTS